MCKRNCIHRMQAGSMKDMCNYHAGGQTRSGSLSRQLGKAASDPEVMIRLRGEYCPFYEWNGQKPDTKTKEPNLKALSEKQTQEKKKWQPPPDYQPAPEKRLRALYAAGLNDREIGEALGLARNNIRMWRKSHGLPDNYTANRNSLDTDRVERLYRQGLNDREIAEKMRVSIAQVYQWRQKNALPTNTGFRGTPAQRELRERLYAAGLSDREIARNCGKSPTWVKNWRATKKLPRNREPRTNRRTEQETNRC